MLPRASRCASRFADARLQSFKPGGTRRRTSRPRPLTLRTSQCQRTAPVRPGAARKPRHAAERHANPRLSVLCAAGMG